MDNLLKDLENFDYSFIDFQGETYVPDLQLAKMELYRLLSLSYTDVSFLLKCINNGAIDGKQFVGIGCSCLIGAVLMSNYVTSQGPNDVLSVCYDAKIGLSMSGSHLQMLVFPVNRGDTPKTQPRLALIQNWINEYYLSDNSL